VLPLREGQNSAPNADKFLPDDTASAVFICT